MYFSRRTIPLFLQAGRVWPPTWTTSHSQVKRPYTFLVSERKCVSCSPLRAPISALRPVCFNHTWIFSGWSPDGGESREILALPGLLDHALLQWGCGLDCIQGCHQSSLKLGELSSSSSLQTLSKVLHAANCGSVSCLQIDMFSTKLHISNTTSSPVMVNVFRNIQPNLPVTTQAASSTSKTCYSLGLLALSLALGRS